MRLTARISPEITTCTRPPLTVDSLSIPKTPYHVIWGITSACNSRCIHCYANGGEKARGEITTALGFKVIDELADLGVFDIGFTGGEPLLRKDIYPLVSRAASNGLSTGISTNGLLLTEDSAKRLRDHGLERLQVSIDGIGQTHDLFRGISGLYQKAIDSLEICAKVGLKRLVCFTATRWNVTQLVEMIALLNALGIDTLNISIFVPTGRGDKGLSLSPLEMKTLYEFWKTHREQKKRPTLVFHTSKMALVSKEVASQSGFIGCQAGCGTAYIDPEGYITPCVLLPIRLGNIRSSSFEAIWRDSLLIKNLRQRRLLGQCGDCKYTKKCGGCRAIAFSHYNDPLASDPSCWIFQN